ncbi:hypothetical protein CQ12_05535 [Bradyrhizobium jicamae]|uniref:Uncharacterized protein n=1 Tax=Bradyrhizobium jicamae TaxID=280332 RepID=A0A0R3LTM6_9BRAD|nr:hypothetical protein [Bradyrhizobium jicamae]KRR11289.1 hypothetical protein CQ12_05535 [Bradyrhizobium jicamae]
MIDTQTTMTDAEPAATATAGIRADLERIGRDLAAVMERLRAMEGEESLASQDDSPPRDLMRPGDVIHEFGIPRSTLHRLCRANPIRNADGFAFFDPVKQRYLISRSRITAFLRRSGTSWDVRPG